MTQWRIAAGGSALHLLSQITRATARYQLLGEDHLRTALDSGQPVIIAAWHGMTMLLAGFFLRRFADEPLIILLPDDWRGQTLAHWISRTRLIPMAMNVEADASLGAARGLAQLLRRLRNGQRCYITPDGPDGPAFKVKPGVPFLAQRARGVILPVAGYVRHGYVVPRWDTYAVPFPFSRISIAFGEPLPAPQDASLAAIADSLTDALHRISAQARAAYYVKPRHVHEHVT